MVGKTPEGLNADDIRDAAFDQFNHFTGQEPALAGLVADVDNRLCIFHHLIDAGRRFEVPALFIFAVDGAKSHILNGVNGDIHAKSGRFGGSQIFCLVNLIVKTIQHKAHEVRNHSLGALCLQNIHQMVVGCVGVFHEDLAYDADAGLFEVLMNRKRIKIADDLTGELLHLAEREALGIHQEIRAFPGPFLIHRHDRALFRLIGAHAVDALHQNIAEDYGEGEAGDQRERDLKAGVPFQTGEVGGNHRDLFHAGLLERSADEADVVGCAAAAAGLRHDDSGFVQVIFAGGECLHDLAYHEEGRVARVVVHIFQTVVDGRVVVVAHQNEVVAAGPCRRLNQVKVDGRHLRAQDGVAFLEHLLGEGNLGDAG